MGNAIGAAAVLALSIVLAILSAGAAVSIAIDRNTDACTTEANHE